LGYLFSSYVEFLSSWVVVAVVLTATLTTLLTAPFISLLALFILKLVLVLAILNNLEIAYLINNDINKISVKINLIFDIEIY